eukprot:gene31108-biopygen32534
MLRTFVRWRDVSAIVSVGCCYNLLTESQDAAPGLPHQTPVAEGAEPAVGREAQGAARVSTPAGMVCVPYTARAPEGVEGFPMSTAGQALGLPLGREGRTLACQSAEQWASTSAAATATMFQYVSDTPSSFP